MLAKVSNNTIGHDHLRILLICTTMCRCYYPSFPRSFKPLGMHHAVRCHLTYLLRQSGYRSLPRVQNGSTTQLRICTGNKMQFDSLSSESIGLLQAITVLVYHMCEHSSTTQQLTLASYNKALIDSLQIFQNQFYGPQKHVSNLKSIFNFRLTFSCINY